MTLNPTFVDLSVNPPKTANATVEARDANWAGDHWVIGAGGAVVVRFSGGAQSDELTLKVRALVSKAGPTVGHAPLTILVNDRMVASQLRIPGGGDLPQWLTFSVPGDWLTGENVLELRSGQDALTMLWLYTVLLESVWDRDAAERALLADGARRSAFTYATRYAVDQDEWRSGSPLRIWIDDGQASVPAELTWRVADGSEGAIAFAREMTTFLGHVRDARGRWSQYSGVLVERAEGPVEPALRFRTEHLWGGAWHMADDLRLHVDVGAEPVERLGWRDQRGNLSSIGLDGTSFLGYAQHVNEGPIGYRGRYVDLGTGDIAAG